MPSTPVLKARGLNLSPNQLTVEPGSLVQASNVIIRRDDVVEPRRGFKLFGESFGSTTDVTKQLFVYRDRLLRHYNQIIQFQNGTHPDGMVNFDSFSGTYSEPETGLRIKSIESNGNLYFTTDEGIKKISAKTASELSTTSGYITDAGGIKALDMDARLSVELALQTGFLPEDSAVAYRHLWNRFDANNNLIQGTPSQRVEIYNTLETLLIRDLNSLLLALDHINQSGSLITDGTYVSTLGLAITDSASDVRTNSIALATKLDADIEVTEDGTNTASATVASTTTLTLVFNNDVSTRIQIGDRLSLSGFTAVGLTQLNSRLFDVTGVSTVTVTATVVGAVLANQAITVDTGGVAKRAKYTLLTQPSAPGTPPTDAELLDLQDYISEIMTNLQAEPIGIISSALQTAFILDLDITTSANVIVEITLPEAATVNDFFQLYRSSIVEATGTTVLTDLIPDDEMQLVYEKYLTTAEISAGRIVITDVTPDEFRGANLYTNEATGEGATQANDLPPFALDINRFKNSIFYANTRTRHRKLMSLLGVENMITDYGTGQITKTFGTADINTSTNVITINSHGFADGQSVRFTNATPTNLPGGLTQGTTYYIYNKTVNTFQLTTSRDSSTPVDITSGGTGTHTIANMLPKLTVANSSSSQTYSFIKGIKQIWTITAGADTANSLDGTYFEFYSANDDTKYYIWLSTSGGSATDPLRPNATGVKVYITTGETAVNVALKIKNTLKALSPDFLVSVLSTVVTATNVNFGYTTSPSAGTSGFALAVTTSGQGENATNKEILLSDDVSPAIAVDDTARSVIRILNANDDESIYAFYLSTANTVPGKIYLEARELDENPFYLVGINSTVGESFSPDISGENTAIIITLANPTVITTTSAHGFTTGDSVIITNSNSTPTIDGVRTVTVLSSTTFSVAVNVTVAGTFAVISSADFAEVSENENKPNRIYYAKINQPEAVPLTNFFDVGAEEKAILRIFPLRDSLFVFKQDGIYRISGESIPFNLALFDGSAKLLAPDSIGLVDNLIFCWADEGIVSISESGVSDPISRPIDTVLLKLSTQQYTNFDTATFGIGYHSDKSYYIWTVSGLEDEIATICYRFNTLTGTWTTFDKTNTCGLISDVDDKMYLGAGDTNYVEIERKDFTRYDYSDREIEIALDSGNYFEDELKFSTVADFEIGDVLVQEQTLTVYGYNSLLRHLDNDPGVQTANYLSTLEAVGGDNLRDKLIDLTQKLDTDTGVVTTNYETTIETKTGAITAISTQNPCRITSASHGLLTGRIVRISASNSTPTINDDFEVTVINANTFSIDTTVTTAGTSGTFLTVDDDFRDLETCFNETVTKLNTDTGLSFSNYESIDGNTSFEAIVTGINSITKKVTVNLTLDFVIGDMLLFKAIDSVIVYAPNHGGDPTGFKQFREAKMFFENKAFTNAVMAFGSDLLPAFNTVPFDGDGNGIFGHATFGSGFFGGNSHAVPFRTTIPRKAQRCRFLNVKFEHRIAREGFSIFGIEIDYETYALGERAYKG